MEIIQTIKDAITAIIKLNIKFGAFQIPFLSLVLFNFVISLSVSFF